MNCPKCRSTERIKSGIVRNKSGINAKECGFTTYSLPSSSLSRTPRDKQIKCIRLIPERVGFQSISRLTGVSQHTTVMRWVHKLGDDIDRFRPQTEEVESVNVMELDEMWHFVPKKRTNTGPGEPMTVIGKESVVFSLAEETPIQARN